MVVVHCVAEAVSTPDVAYTGFFFEMLLRQPYIEMKSSPQNIFVLLFEISTTLKGGIYYHHQKPNQTHGKYLNTSINHPESGLYTPLLNYLYRTMIQLCIYSCSMLGK